LQGRLKETLLHRGRKGKEKGLGKSTQYRSKGELDLHGAEMAGNKKKRKQASTRTSRFPVRKGLIALEDNKNLTQGAGVGN